MRRPTIVAPLLCLMVTAASLGLAQPTLPDVPASPEVPGRPGVPGLPQPPEAPTLLIVASWGFAGGSGSVSREPGVATDSHFPIPCGAITCPVVGLIDSRCDTHTCSKLRLNDAGAGNESNTLNTSSAAGKASANLYWGNQQVYLQGTDLSAASGTFSGNVGIGTTSPASILHALRLGANGGRGLTLQQSDSTNEIGIEFRNGAASGGAASAITLTQSGAEGLILTTFPTLPSGKRDINFKPGDITAVTFKEGGNVGIGTTSPQARLHVAGDIRADGHLFAHSSSHVGDAAEPVVGAGLEAGMVVVLDGFDARGMLRVKASGGTLARDVVGVVSTNPSLRLAGGPTDTPLAVTGIVPVKVVGPVAAGDLLTTSAVRGHAMACLDPDACFGAVLGKALEGLDAGEGLVRAMVALR